MDWDSSAEVGPLSIDLTPDSSSPPPGPSESLLVPVGCREIDPTQLAVALPLTVSGSDLVPQPMSTDAEDNAVLTDAEAFFTQTSSEDIWADTSPEEDARLLAELGDPSVDYAQLEAPSDSSRSTYLMP